MNREPRDLPAFLREEPEGTPDTDSAPVERLVEVFDAGASDAGLERLLQAVSSLPLRYSPFVARLAGLWDLPEDEVERVLERSGDPGAWRKPGLPGVALLDVAAGPRTKGASASLVRFAPGLRFPRHRHPGHEAVFVLEGSYTDSAGRHVGPGDLHEMKPGSEHGFVVASHEPCIAASVQAGLEFTGPLMRLLQKVFGR